VSKLLFNAVTRIHCYTRHSEHAGIWQLQVSVPKCSVLHLGNRNSCMSYDLNGIVLPDVKSTGDLGVTVDSNLRYKLHINNMS